MKTLVRLALVGDYNSAFTAHQAIPLAIDLAAQHFSIEIHADWLATNTITPEILNTYDAFWSVPGSPYRSTEGALSAIRFARENRKPFLGTCGGFQHAIIEYARNVMDWQDAGHGETDTEGRLVISALSCEMVEVKSAITFVPGSIPARAYGKTEAEEGYHCRYGINTEFQAALEAQPMKMVGYDAAGEVRAIELPEHPFFVATLFQPERAALQGRLPPLVAALIKSVL
ncbi:CTP synthase C-terminal region-related (seleno)protein [Rahnella sp. PCH160]|uniref:CTP synthase C-terminal region-related (seleno)protein n=1 Tax=Rahnella sp. PCH160 TaxID=3447928 RepID=UPI0039FDDA36